KAKELSHRASLAGLTMGISHEIRNPLTAIRSNSQLLRDKLLGVDGQDKHPWKLTLSPDSFSAITGSAQTSAAVFDWIKTQGFLNDDNQPNLANDDINPYYEPLLFDLPGDLAPFSHAVTTRFAETFKRCMVLDALNLTMASSDRVVRIATSMMQYGASTGISKNLFLKISGFDETMAEALWLELNQKRYIDPYGGTIQPFNPFAPGVSLDLSDTFKPYEATILDLIRSVVNIPKSELDIQTPLSDALQMIKSNLLAQKGNPIVCATNSAHTRRIWGEETRIFQVFSILLNNAVEAMQSDLKTKKHTLSVSTADDNFLSLSGDRIQGVRVCIQDTGCGISQDNMEKLRNPFFTTKGVTGGRNAGLGLSILYEVVERHGGRVDIDSEEGVGTTFVVHFPGV
ncbi:MAG: ATP-binding protein, partial [Candidatus Margulisiibacteriota bacterium]